MTWFHCSSADSGEELDHVISKGPSSLEKTHKIRIFQPMIEFTRVNSNFPDFLLILKASLALK